MQAAALEAARLFEKETLDRLRRMSIIAADLEVKSQKKGAGNHAMGGGGESQYEELSMA